MYIGLKNGIPTCVGTYEQCYNHFNQERQCGFFDVGVIPYDDELIEENMEVFYYE